MAAVEEQRSFSELGYVGFPVRLAAFEGPLDLLVHLVRKKQVPLDELPLAEICDQYLEYLREAEAFEVEVTSAFVVMAATLLYLKSRGLLPQAPSEATEDEAEDYERTRKALLLQIAEYERYSEVGQFLGARFETFGRTYRRQVAEAEPEAEYDLDRLSLRHLLEAFADLMESRVPREAVLPEEEFSLTEAVGELRQLFAGHRATRQFEELLGPNPDAGKAAAYFLALVHMMFMREARAEQEAPFAPIEVTPRRGGARSGS